MSLSKPFATQLKVLRTVLNERVASTRRSVAGLNTEAFSEFLELGVDPIVRAVSKTAPDRLSILVDEVFTMALTLVSTGHAGPTARQDYVNRLWRDVAPSLSTLIAHDPLESLGTLTNVMIKVTGDGDIRGDEWLSYIEQLAPDAQDIATLRSLCIIASWRSGGVKMRSTALKALSALPQALACKAVGAPKNAKWEKVSNRLAKEIWWRPDGLTVSGHVVGDFSGFRGAFLAPPRIKPAQDGFLVRSADLCFYLAVDAFGTKLHSLDTEVFENAKTGTGPRKTKSQSWENLFPAEGLSLVSNADSVAVTSPYSYSIHVSPLSDFK